MFSHEKLTVYQRALDFLVFSTGIIKMLKHDQNELKQQYQRASLSICLNIAEGAGRVGNKEQSRFYGIARGSALECAAILDACKIVAPETAFDIDFGKQLLLQVVAMLSKMCLLSGSNVPTTPKLKQQ
jgi:four helix bundle protein